MEMKYFIGPKFKIGDSVTLNSGGPTMTVRLLKLELGAHLGKEPESGFWGNVVCTWFNPQLNQIETDRFHQDMLSLTTGSMKAQEAIATTIMINKIV